MRKFAKGVAGVATLLLAASVSSCGSDSGTDSGTDGGTDSDSAASSGPRVGTFPLDLLTVADKRGVFDQDPAVEFVDSGPAALPLISSKALDCLMGVASLPVVSAEARGIDMKIVWIDGQGAPARLVAQPGIASAQDLTGKKVAVPVGSIAHLLLEQYLVDNAMTLGDVEVIDVPPPQMPAAFTRKSVDAIFVWDPPGQAARAAGGDVLDERGMVTYTVCSSDYIEENPEAVQGFVCGLSDIYRQFADNPDDIYPDLAEAAQIDPEQIEDLFTIKNAAPADQTEDGFFTSDAIVEPLVDAVPFLKARGAIDTEPSEDALMSLFDDTFVKGVSDGACE